MAENVNFTTPVGRIVAGNLYKGSDKDADGNPLLVKSGPNAGQPRVDFFFAVAIPKGPEQHWSQTEWGAKIWAVGHQAFPQAANSPAFAWKVTDGDSQVPNTKGKKPCDREGYKGHWVLAFSSGYAPRIYNADGSQAITELDAVKPGYYVQVNGTIGGNGSQQRPGVFLNHSMVALSGYGPEIISGPDATAVGFGTAPLPPGASAVPIAAMQPPAPPAAPVVAAPVPAYVPPPVAAAPAAPVPVPVAPHTAILTPPAPPVAPVAPARVMLPAAQGATYEQMIANGWNDALLIQHGMMQA